MPQCYQEETAWCWAGCAESILAYYGHPVSQIEIAKYGTKGVNCGNLLWGSSSTKNGIDRILKKFADLACSRFGRALTLEETDNSLFTTRPFIVTWRWQRGGYHFVVAHKKANDLVYIMDPWPTSGPVVGTYDWVVDGGEHKWTHTLRVNTLTCGFNSIVENSSDGNIIKWTVQSEEQVSSYIVQRFDGDVWVDIETVVANSSVEYQVVDSAEVVVDAKYRVIFVRTDGTYQYESVNGDSIFVKVDRGWNLLSLPCDLPRIFRKRGVWHWNDDGYYQLLTNVEPLKGFWYYSTTTEVIEAPILNAPIKAEVELVAGWNLVGPKNYCLPPDNVDVLFEWNHGYRQVLDDGERLEITHGYWMFVVEPKTVKLSP